MRGGTAGYIIIVILLVATSAISINLFFKEKTSHDKLQIASFPYTMGEWIGKDLEVTEKEYKILETRNLLLREYSNPSGEKIALFIIYSETNRSVFHPPEVCLIGSGITIVDRTIQNIKFNGYNFQSNKLYLDKNGIKEMALYVYKAGKIYTDSYYFQQADIALHQLFKRNVPGATIRVSTIVTDTEEKTLARMASFLQKTVTTLENLS